MVRRRLYIKTAPQNAPAYPERALLKKSEYRIAKGKLKEAHRKEWLSYKAVRSQAVAAMANQTEIGGSQSDYLSQVASCQAPHPSHHITAMAQSRDVNFCRVCACWSLRLKLRGLASRCEGLKAGKASTLRLLQCGVRPAPEARLPPQHVKIRRRKCRW